MSDQKVRIDKWLWAARFFKTRAIASDAVNGGKVHLDGQRIKASRSVRIGDLYEVQRGYDKLQIVVDLLADRRGSASVAKTMFHETDRSIERRKKEAGQRELARLSRPVTEHKPNKKERRILRGISGKN